MPKTIQTEVIIVGGGLAGLSAGIYLGRAQRDTLIIDSGKSMARWEPDIQNYLGFPGGIAGEKLLKLGRQQAERYGIRFRREEIVSGARTKAGFELRSKQHRYRCKRLLIATGIFHIPPDIPNVTPCLGHSMFFCKDCDGYRVRNRAVVIYGWTNEGVDYALAMLHYSPCVTLVTDGRSPGWDQKRRRWVKEYKIPVYTEAIHDVSCSHGQIQKLHFKGGMEATVEALFTTRGDVYFNKLAKTLGARVDEHGEIIVNESMQTNVRGLYAAGCVTPANCQMIIAAGEGAIAAQAINRDLFEESLRTHSLRRFRQKQVRTRKTRPTLSKRKVSAKRQ